MVNRTVHIETDLELRNVTLDPRPGSEVDFLVTGTHLPGALQVCQRFAHDFGIYFLDLSLYLQDLCEISKHDRGAYGYLHPSTFTERFYDRVGDTSFVESTAFAFFLLPILKYKIASEMEKGWARFMVLGLESLLRATREFTKQIAQPVALLCFRDISHEGLVARPMIEQLFDREDLVDVWVDPSRDIAYSNLLMECLGKRGLPALDRYLPSS